MSWAARRRFIIALIVGAVVVAFVTVVGIATFYKAPTCTDSVQNQGEAGVDCGGPCAYLCTEQEQPPTVLFTKVIQNDAGRTDVIASVENKNATAAAKDVPYRVTLYDSKHVLIQTITGTLDLPPNTTVPIYLPGILSGKQTAVNAFVSIEASSLKWFTMAASQRSVPLVLNSKQSGTITAPRIEATLANPTATPFSNVQTIVIVHNKSGDVIAVSQTVIPLIPAQGQATAIFTWNKAFPDTPAAIEVVPIIPLP